VASSAEGLISITSTLLARLQREAGVGQAWVRVCVRRRAIRGQQGGDDGQDERGDGD
jgi:hypothetical protein